MGTSTFSGPLRSGSIFNTSGTTLGQDVKNVGNAVLGQAASVTQVLAQSTEIVIPAGSCIVSIDALITTAFDGVASTFNVGTTSGGAELVSAAAGGTVGRVSLAPGANATRTALWKNTGTSDIRIWVNSTNAGNGVAAIVVRYLQAQGVA